MSEIKPHLQMLYKLYYPNKIILPLILYKLVPEVYMRLSWVWYLILLLK